MEDNLRARLLIREGLELDSLDVHAVLLLGLVAMSWLGYREKRNGRGDLVGFCIGLVRPVVGRGTAGSSGMGAPSYVLYIPKVRTSIRSIAGHGKPHQINKAAPQVTGSGAAASRNRPDRILDVNTGSWGQYSQVLNNARHSPRRHRTLFYVSCSMIPGAAGFHGDSRNNMTWYIQNDTRFCFWCLAHYRGSDTALEDTHLVTESRVTPSGSAEESTTTDMQNAAQAAKYKCALFTIHHLHIRERKPPETQITNVTYIPHCPDPLVTVSGDVSGS